MALPIRLTAGSSQHRTYQGVTWGLFALVVVLVPFLIAQPYVLSLGSNNYTVSLLNAGFAVAWMVAILGLNVVTGYSGQISLGNSFFVGAGAYITAVLVADFNWSYLSTLVIVIPALMVFGMLVGVPALRIRGLYLALVTFGLAAIFPSLVRLEEVSDWTGGSNGKAIDSALEPPSWAPVAGTAEWFQDLPGIGPAFGSGGLTSRQEDAVYRYFLLVIIAALAFWVTRNIIRSRIGRGLVAIRDNETGAAVSGVNLALNKTQAFGVSAALGGVAGSMFAIQFEFVGPDSFGTNLAIFLIVGLLVGGAATLAGPVVGGLVIVFVPHWASETEELPAIGELEGPWGTGILGALLILLTFVLPGGVVHGMRVLRNRVVTVLPVPPTISYETTQRGRENTDEEAIDDAARRPVGAGPGGGRMRQ